MGPAFAKPVSMPSPTGALLHAYHQPAQGTPRAIVQINHGLAEHAGRYGRFAHALAAVGIASFAHDHRGHGHTTAPDAPVRSFATGGDGLDKVLADVAAVHAHIRTQHPGLPVFIFGHSMGGLIAMNYVLRHPDHLAGVAVWNANFSGGIAGRAAQAILKWERFRMGSDVPSRILPKLTFGQWAKTVKDRRTDFDWLSHIPAEVDAYIADPLCGWDASIGMWQDVFAMIFAGGAVQTADSAAKALPFHLLGGGQDPATDMAKATRAQAERMENAGFADVTLTVYDDARHETLNDHVSEKATDELIAWIEARV